MSSFDTNDDNAMRQRPFRSVLDVPPKKEELEVALSALKNGRSSGKNGLTLEVVKHVGQFLMNICWSCSKLCGRLERFPGQILCWFQS